MLVEQLVAFHGRLQDQDVLPPAHYQIRAVHWFLELDGSGCFKGWVQAGEDLKRGIVVARPFCKRTSGVSSQLLIDNAQYVLGLTLPEKLKGKASEAVEREEARTRECHAAYVALIEGLAAEPLECEDEAEPVCAVNAFFKSEEQLEAARQSAPEGLKAAHDLGVRVDGVQVQRLGAARRYWARYRDAQEEEGAALTSECLVTGQTGLIAQVHPVAIRLGGETPALVSANDNASTSYGLKRSEIAPMLLGTARAYGEALVYLLETGGHHYRCGEVTYVFWTRQGDNLEVGLFLDDPKEDDVRRLLASTFQPREAVDVDPRDFYACALTANKSRLVVRDYVETTVPAVQRGLASWFDRQRLLDAQTGESMRPYGIFPLAASLHLDARKMTPRPVPALIRAALFGDRLPHDLLLKALRRVSIGTKLQNGSREHLTRPLAVIIKIATNDLQTGVPLMEALNREDHRPAYLCGRLFAVLEEIQRAALGWDINATVADRFYGTASSAPASVFGRLMRGAQAHLQKLRKTNSGAWTNLQREIEAITAPLSSFPRTLTIVEQGQFAIGYYHQRAEGARLRNERRAAREAAASEAQASEL